MDGVLARFEQAPDALERFATEAGFFRTLEPTKYVKTVRATLAQYPQTYILTSSPNEQADADKRAWIEQYVPELAKRVICVRTGLEKAKFAKGAILIDDYTENLVEWERKGGIGIKALNGLNGKTLRYKEVTKGVALVD